jgi:5-formyltetrahydrofolate cyclo-ligase
MTPQQLRSHYRRIRAQIPPAQQQANAVALAEHIESFLGNIRSQRIAAYLSTGGEISLGPWMRRQQRHRVFLPKLYVPIEPRLRFAELTADTRWMQNRFLITEPAAHWGNTRHARELDVILMPLVAFDLEGNRLGMGGGYYDRSMAFRRNRQSWRKPRLIGVAHSQQRHEGLPQNPWDVPLDYVITEQGVLRTQR